MAQFLLRSGRLWHRLGGVLLLIGAIALSGCSLDQFKTSAAQVPQIVTSIGTDPKTFNYVLSEESPNIFTVTYEGMLSQNGVTGELEPALAESWEISPDNLRITFTLRPGLKWSDGEPLTADDVLFTFNDLIFNEDIPTSNRDVLRIGDSGALPQLRKIDNRRIEFTVPEPFAPFLRFVGGTAIQPKHALNSYVYSTGVDGKPRLLSAWGTATDPSEIVSNGPYQLEQYVPAQRLVFRRNPYYWRKDNLGNQQPYVERLIWQIVESTEAQMIQFRSGGLEAIGVNPQNYSLLKREEQRGNFTILEGGPAFGTSFISFNLSQGRRNGQPFVDPIKSKWFNTVAFRQAIAYGIDRQTMINNIYRGIGQTQDSPISVQSPYYLSPQEGLKTYEYDPEKSRELLLGAGFEYNAAGQLLDADGNRVRFTLLSNAGSQTAEAIGSQIKRDLDLLGIQVDFQLISFNSLVDRLDSSFDWECVFIAFTGGVEPNGGANFWRVDGRLHMFNMPAPAGEPAMEGRVIADWEQRISDLYIQGARTLDEARRREIYAETQQLAQEYLPTIHMINPLSMSAVRNYVEGVEFSALGGSLWNIYELKLVE